MAGGTIARFLLLGSELSSARHAHDILTTNLASILNDGMIPVTRSAKEELSSLRSELASINFAPDDPSPESDMFVSFRALYTKAKEAKDNINLVETELDESVRLLISKAFGEERTPSLEPSILEAEVQSLTDVASSIIHSKGNQETADKWMVEDAAVLSLVANSLQRLHAAPDDDEDEGAEIEEDEEETAEDDEDDMVGGI